MSALPSLPRKTWIAACSHRLQRQWPSIDPDQLEELADTLWQDQRLRLLEPTDAAVEWLQPVLADQPKAAARSAAPGQVEHAAVGQPGDDR
ncbi:hypothetical protein [Piscinibacter sakaiensis]|uniref:hypothetical protein n=1 Tax=Piscinibacter sakaiensis TaxID=1547922 RepID=UPI003AAEFD0B